MNTMPNPMVPSSHNDTMKLLLASVVLAVAFQSSFAVDEPDNRTPLERYRGDTQYALVMCNITLRLALAGG